MRDRDFRGFDRVWQRVTDPGGGFPPPPGGPGGPGRPLPPGGGFPPPPPGGPPPEREAVRLLGELAGLYGRLGRRFPWAGPLYRGVLGDLRSLGETPPPPPPAPPEPPMALRQRARALETRLMALPLPPRLAYLRRHAQARRGRGK